jgi:hypothetical protein
MEGGAGAGTDRVIGDGTVVRRNIISGDSSVGSIDSPGEPLCTTLLRSRSSGQHDTQPQSSLETPDERKGHPRVRDPQLGHHAQW